MSEQKLSFSTYLTLYIPSLEWLCFCLCNNNDADANSVDILRDFKSLIDPESNPGIFALALNSFLTTFSPTLVSTHASTFLDMVKSVASKANSNSFPMHILIKNLGKAFVSSHSVWQSQDSNDKLHILNDVWKVVTKLDVSGYLICAEVWIEFVVQNFGVREINTILKDIVKHMSKVDRETFENHYDQFLSIASKISKFSGEDFSSFFAMDNFMPFLDLIQKESVKVDASKIIVKAFLVQAGSSDYQDQYISDPVILNAMVQLCKTMHDSVNALTLEDDRRQISELIIDFLALVKYDDPEGQFNFYVESRANYSNLENVLSFLVHIVNRLAMEQKARSKGQKPRQTGAFIRTCLSYSFITIPSLDDFAVRLQLYLSSAQVALQNSCLSQTDSFVRAAILLLSQLPANFVLSDGRTVSSDPFFVSYTSNLVSFLLVVPVSIASFYD